MAQVEVIRQVSPDLDQIALDNIVVYSDELQPGTDDGLVTLYAGCTCQASLILLPGVWDWLHDRLGPELIVGVPNRDTVLVADARNAGAVERLRQDTRRSFITRAYPVSGQMFRRKDGDMVPWR